MSDLENISLWIKKDEALYEGAVEFMKDYKGERPYIDFCIESGLSSQRTPDGVQWISEELSYSELDAIMKELVADFKQKVPASEMCWTHLEPIGKCSCDYEEEL